jgi:hypothetical protein
MVMIMTLFLAVSGMLLMWMLVILPDWLEPTGEQTPSANRQRQFEWRTAILRWRKPFDQMVAQLADTLRRPFKETLKTQSRRGFYS